MPDILCRMVISIVLLAGSLSAGSSRWEHAPPSAPAARSL